MKGRLVALIIHADDFGITVEQSKAILELSDACGGHGALSSMSMFANSPAFNECAELVRPFVDAGKIKLGLHLNIVEGHPVSNPDDVPLLVNERGTFSDCLVTTARLPVEPIGPHLKSPRRIAAISPVNLVKDALLALLAPHCRKDLEGGSHVADFSGIVLSGCMQKTTPSLIADMEARAVERGRDLEVLFHPISVPVEQCLDPENLPFAQACASPNRDAEAKLIASLSTRA